MTVRPTPEQVLLLAPDRHVAAAAAGVADAGNWSAAGCDDQAVWGLYIGSTAEPYEVSVELTVPAFRCTCPSRKLPCKHCLGLLLLHAQHGVQPARRLPFVDTWLQRRASSRAALEAGRALPADEPEPELEPEPAPVVPPDAVVDSRPEVAADGELQVAVGRSALGATAPAQPRDGDPQRDKRRTERAERMRAGLVEFDRWLADRVRVGLSAAELAQPDTWDRVAARLVDAQCGGLANRVKRVATRVGQHQQWHHDVLEELAVLHLLVNGALRTSVLPADLADGVHAATGLTTLQADVLAGVPSTARWQVLGESRVREDRITVQRTWLRAVDAAGSPDAAPTWALVLSFGALGNELQSDYVVGAEFDADVHWYPGAAPLRALVGRMHSPVERGVMAPRGLSVDRAIGLAGWAVAAEPWLERVPLCIEVVPVPLGDGRWVLADDTGALPVVAGFWRLAELVAVGGGRPATVMGEWSAEGFLPLTVWADTGRGTAAAVVL
jgi:hypothetical protein